MRFVHTADWQLGMRRALLDDDAQARFAQARVDAIGAVGAVAEEHGAAFAVVAGDVFESNHLERRTIHRALERLADVPVPVWLLPGNHDPLDASSVYRSTSFTSRCPAHVQVLDDTQARPAAPGAEVVGIPWTSNQSLEDRIGSVVAQLPVLEAGQERVVVGHGVVPGFSGDRHRLDVLDVDVVERALAERRLSFLALGDRHSTTRVSPSGRIWYAGAPEPTRFTEIDAGNVLVVDVEGSRCDVTPVHVGTWRFAQWRVELARDEDVEALRGRLDGLADAARTVLRLDVAGVVGLHAAARFDALVDEVRDRVAACDVRGRHDTLVAVADDDDLADLDLGPVTRSVAAELSEVAAGGGGQAATATRALGLLYRLVRSAP